MDPRQPSRLLDFHLWETHDPDEMEEVLSREMQSFRHEIPNAKGFYLSAHIAPLELLQISCIRASPQRAFTNTDYRFYNLVLWREGGTYFHTSGRREAISVGQGLLCAPYFPSSFITRDDREVLVVRIPADLFHQRVEFLAGKPQKAPLLPVGVLEQNGPVWRGVENFLLGLEPANGILREPSVLRQEQQIRIIDYLILSTPHNIVLRQPRSDHNLPSLNQFKVRRAEEHMDAHLLEVTYAGDLANAISDNEQNLARAFSKVRRKTWQTVLREKRLDYAHQRLLHPVDVIAVKDVATEVLMSPSYLDRHYAKRFGELPSKTLQKGWGRLGLFK